MKKIIMMVGAMLLTVGFTACGDDDDNNTISNVLENNVTSTDIPAPYLTDASGNKLQVASVGEIRYTYNESGKLSGIIIGDYDRYELGETFTFTTNKSSDRKTEYAIYTNTKGLIAKSEYKYSRMIDSNWSVREAETRNYNYNSDNQLTSITYERSYIEENDNGTRKGTVTFNWANGNLTSVIDTSTDSYTNKAGEQKVKNDKDTYTFEYGSQANVFKQMPAIMCEAVIDSEELALLAVLGLFGTGPAYLPTNLTRTDEDGRSYTYATPTYELNADGSIKKELGIEYQYNK